MKTVIINADDFGLCHGVNQGIILAHQKGILTSATLMANTPGFEEAVELSKENKKLGVGIHLNIVRGEPLLAADKVRTLLSNEGRFFSSVFLLLRKLASKKVNLQDIEREFRAQIEKALKAGITPSHFDSEKHIHCLPSIFKIVLKLGKEYGIRKVRYINEYCFSPRNFRTANSFFRSLFCALMKKKVRESGLVITDRFYGICNRGYMAAQRLKKILTNLDEATAEIMVHPGYITQELKDLERRVGSYYINKYRENELEALLDAELKKIVQSQKIQLINFNELKGHGK